MTSGSVPLLGRSRGLLMLRARSSLRCLSGLRRFVTQRTVSEGWQGGTVNDTRDERPMSTVRAVTGRDAKDGEKGLPKLAHIEIDHPDGSTWVATSTPHEGEEWLTRFAREIRRGAFVFCPICFDRDADSQEHVPPQNLGGLEMATTCTRCNNLFGTRVERDLQDWFDHVVTIQVRVGDDPKPVSVGRAHVMLREDGSPMLHPERGSRLNFGVEDGVPLNDVTWRIVEPSIAHAKLAVLKSAYLAASLHLGGVPNLPSATEIRAELQEVIKAKSRVSIRFGPHSENLRFFRTGQPAADPRLALMRHDNPDLRPLISLAGTLLVEWPFPEVDPLSPK